MPTDDDYKYIEGDQVDEVFDNFIYPLSAQMLDGVKMIFERAGLKPPQLCLIAYGDGEDFLNSSFIIGDADPKIVGTIVLEKMIKEPSSGTV